MNLTTPIRPYFIRRISSMLEAATNPEAIQRRELAQLLHEGKSTLIGERYGYSSIKSYEDYAKRVPVMEYCDIRGLVERMIAGERDILWRGVTRNFAQSSGTSDGKSKYVPITAASFKRNHYQGGSDAVSRYLYLNPESRMFSGKGFILGGSFANELSLSAGVKVGDLSANLIDNINPLVNLVRIPSKRVALMSDWSKKLPALVDASMRCDVTNISGVPSWFLTVLKEVIKRSGASSIHDVWPNLEVFFHGGISFTHYREQYAKICDNSKMHYLETYNASEGFFAVQERFDDAGLMLLLDIGVFYEFIPIEELGQQFPAALTSWQVEVGKTYALVITSCNGLWRYMLGDTVTVTSVAPLKIVISGRTKHFINAFGEELMVYNAEAAITATCQELECEVSDFTAAPVYAGDRTRGRHEWLIEFEKEPADIAKFATLLDQKLCEENSDYQAKRSGGIFLDKLSVVKARRGLFNDWLATTGKLGGQRKVPRLSNERTVIESMLNLNG